MRERRKLGFYRRSGRDRRRAYDLDYFLKISLRRDPANGLWERLCNNPVGESTFQPNSPSLA
jgi:hypothetical protein